MNDDLTLTNKRRNRGLLGAGGLIAAGAIAGGIFAATLPASAADTTSTTAATTTAAAPPANSHSATSVRTGETALTGSDLAKAKAAALAAVPGATIYRAETDADGAVYEVHLTKSDGTDATVKLDAAFKVTGVEAGMGAGAPGAAPTSASAA